MKSCQTFLSCLFLLVAGLDCSFSYHVQDHRAHRGDQSWTQPSETRRSFWTTTAATLSTLATLPQPAFSVDIKVSPLAHTFITSSGSAKPIRENDATRFFTNARVVFLIEGKGAEKSLASEVLQLTVARKAGKGPGVTPGNVQLLSSSTSLIDTASGLGVEVVSKSESSTVVAGAAKSLAEGDILFVGPISSGGTGADGKILAETAQALGTFVGGKTGGGVISVLLDGPGEGLKLEEGGYPTSDLLWYSLPSK